MKILKKFDNRLVSSIDKVALKDISLYPIGLDWDKLSIVQYNTSWPIKYKEESERIFHKFPSYLEKLEHVGSTAVPDLGAKPIIDIIGAVSSIEDIENQLMNLFELGYSYLGECGRPGRHFFTYNIGATTFFHLHLVNKDSSYWFDLVSFRDKLRSNKKLAYDYYQYKIYLLKKYGNNRKKYREGKEAWFIRQREK